MDKFWKKIPDIDDSGNENIDPINELKNKIKSIEQNQNILINQINKRQLIIVISIVVGIAIFVDIDTLNKHEVGQGLLKSNYEIEDLKGEKINTWVSWKITSGDLFHIHVLASPLVTDERMKVIRDVIFSNQTVTMEYSTYYKGWEGALQEASRKYTKFPIPWDFYTEITDTGTGNIIIKLTNLENPDGYTAYTKSITDAGNHQILKSEITIYEVDKLSDDNLALMLRHELGHGFGLAHSDEPSDLMHATIDPPQGQYISECDVEALVGLYNGSEKNHVVCQR